MCGRYTLAKPEKNIKKHFDPVIIKCEHSERYNIAPGQNTPVIMLQDNQRELRAMRWGFVPSWSKNIKTAKIGTVIVLFAYCTLCMVHRNYLRYMIIY